MALFLLIDPVHERRAVLKVLLGSQHRLVEHVSMQDAVVGCQDQSFDAAFVAWPDGVRNHHDKTSPPAWSSERLVLMLASQAEATRGTQWAKDFCGRDPILLSWPVSASDIATLLAGFVGAPSATLPEMVGSSAVMRRLLSLAAKAAANDRPVLLCGERGTGKEALARWIHARSSRREGPFETFHCTGLDPTTAFGELFGHEKGAFSWATQARRGILAAADRGTLYLHELSELDNTLQLKLLRLLERPAFGIERLGGHEPCPVDVRIIAGTRLPARQLAGREVCEELFYRLAQNQL